MPDYEVVEHRPNPSDGGKFVIACISFPEPLYIKAISAKDLQNGSKVAADSEKLFIDREEIGQIINSKSAKDVSVSYAYDIKYAGGYSMDGKTVYVSRGIPKNLDIDGKEIDMLECIGLHHELVEKWLVDDAYEYQYAHLVATKAERIFIESKGIDWNHYTAASDRLLHENYAKKLQLSPKDIDLTPYLCSNDNDAIKEIRATMEP
ncbi:hypothetical protein M1452_01720 [Candidatus Marsarchaeota archaeon]|nr:hypothetical protein [Candidatus Marsarchaeota archaeon]